MLRNQRLYFFARVLPNYERGQSEAKEGKERYASYIIESVMFTAAKHFQPIS